MLSHILDQLNKNLGLVAGILGSLTVLYWKGKAIWLGIVKIWYKMTIPKAFKEAIDANTIQTKATLQVVQGLANSIHELHESNRQIIAELKPNGGSSLRDAVNMIRAHQRARDNTTEHYGVFETDKNGLCVSVNWQYLRMTGRNLEEVKGNGWVNCIHPEDRVRVREEWAKCVQDNRDFEMKYRMIRQENSKEDTVFEVIGRAVVMKDNHDRPYGYYGTIQNTENP